MCVHLDIHNTIATENPADNPKMISHLLGSGAFQKGKNGSTLHGSLEDLLSAASDPLSPDATPDNLATGSKLLSSNGSMWLGTEDGK